jgi:hypothetical protein
VLAPNYLIMTLIRVSKTRDVTVFSLVAQKSLPLRETQASHEENKTV